MKTLKLILTAVAAAVCFDCLAQTGMLDPEAAGRDIPRQAAALMKAEPDLKVRVLPPETPVPDGKGRKVYFPVQSDSLDISPALDLMSNCGSPAPFGWASATPPAMHSEKATSRHFFIE